MAMTYGDLMLSGQETMGSAAMQSLYPGYDGGGLATGLTYREKEALMGLPEPLNPSSFIDRNKMKQLQGGNSGSSYNPAPYITGYGTTEYGRADYDAALANYKSVYGDIKVDKAKVEALAAQFARGGSYGTGRRQEARDVVGQGVARDTASAVASGMSSMSSSRGLNTLAGRELSTLYGNIDDTRAQLELQATGMMTPYTQMLASLQYPTASSYIDRITTPKYSGDGGGGVRSFGGG